MNDISPGMYKKIARMEALAESYKDDLDEVIQSRYEKACENQDEDTAAALARKIRNRLLSESDSVMSLDRLGLKVPSCSTITAWLSFLRSLGAILTGEWAKYRQQLRDLPEQAGFPFNIEFPKKPGEEDDNGSEE